jgi:hypothetical protein
MERKHVVVEALARLIDSSEHVNTLLFSKFDNNKIEWMYDWVQGLAMLQILECLYLNVLQASGI